MSMRLLSITMTGAALLLVVTPFVVSFEDQKLPDHSRELAQDALARIISAERIAFEKAQRFISFGPSEAERRAALGPLDLGPAAELFSFDTLTDKAGRLNVRVVSRADAVRAGRVAPMLESASVAPINSSPISKP
ncbi:MAG: hypothetical protein ACRYF2_19950 [Janthinobacterium lividum]